MDALPVVRKERSNSYLSLKPSLTRTDSSRKGSGIKPGLVHEATQSDLSKKVITRKSSRRTIHSDDETTSESEETHTSNDPNLPLQPPSLSALKPLFSNTQHLELHQKIDQLFFEWRDWSQGVLENRKDAKQDQDTIENMGKTLERLFEALNQDALLHQIPPFRIVHEPRVNQQADYIRDLLTNLHLKMDSKTVEELRKYLKKVIVTNFSDWRSNKKILSQFLPAEKLSYIDKIITPNQKKIRKNEEILEERTGKTH